MPASRATSPIESSRIGRSRPLDPLDLKCTLTCRVPDWKGQGALTETEHDSCDQSRPRAARGVGSVWHAARECRRRDRLRRGGQDRKSTRLNSSHTVISYAVFCLKKKKKNN